MMRCSLGLVPLRMAAVVGGLIAAFSGPLTARDHFVEGPGQLPAALKAARAEPSSRQRAWILREAIDTVWASLKEAKQARRES